MLFYEHKFFWSFGNYMVRTHNAIERYVNLIGISFAFVQVLPFICRRFEGYKFQSPQVIKHAVEDQLRQELIFETFVQKLERSDYMQTAIYGQLFGLGITVLKYVVLYFVIKYAVKSALKEERNQ